MKEGTRMLLVGNGTVITRDPENPLIDDGCVVIDDSLIVEVGDTAELRVRYPEADFLDVGRMLIMPGLINTHMHGYSTFARGMSLKDPSPANFKEILERLWWRLDRTLTLDDVYQSALVTMIDCIKNGTTTIFDHHASAGCIDGSLFKMAEASRQTGIRSCLCYEVSDRDGRTAAENGIRENRDFIRFCRQENDPMLKALFGLHASLTLSDQTLAQCVHENEGSGVGFHIHAAEGIEDLQDARTRYGLGVIERLKNAQILGEKTIAVHCVHVSEREMAILNETKTMVVHNPESNMGNAVGAAPVVSLMAMGVLVGLGTDGYTSDLFESLKATNCLIKHDHRDPGAGWAEAPAMLFENNSTIAGRIFPRPLGRLVPGAYADVIVVDYHPPTPLHYENINAHLLFGVSGRSVDTTIINGRIVMENRKLTMIDEEAVCARSRELAARVWARF